MKNTVNEILKEKIVVIVRGVPREKLLPLAEALYAGGIRLIEYTYNAKAPASDVETAENIAMLARHFEGRMLVGAGTVLTEKQVELTHAAGGKFIISPDTNPAVINKTKELDMVSIPGAMTPTEVLTAHRTGADFVKLFPVTSLGPEYIKAITAPISHVKLLAVGGINENNMAQYLKAGVSGFGIGSNIIDKKMLAEEDYEGITRLAECYLEKIKSTNF